MPPQAPSRTIAQLKQLTAQDDEYSAADLQTLQSLAGIIEGAEEQYALLLSLIPDDGSVDVPALDTSLIKSIIDSIIVASNLHAKLADSSSDEKAVSGSLLEYQTAISSDDTATVRRLIAEGSVTAFCYFADGDSSLQLAVDSQIDYSNNCDDTIIAILQACSKKDLYAPGNNTLDTASSVGQMAIEEELYFLVLYYWSIAKIR